MTKLEAVIVLALTLLFMTVIVKQAYSIKSLKEENEQLIKESLYENIRFR